MEWQKPRFNTADALIAKSVGDHCKSASLPRGFLPQDIILLIVLEFLDCAQPVARLACAAPSLQAGLVDNDGRLCVGSIVTSRLHSMKQGLRHASLRQLQVLNVDLSAESRDHLLPRDVGKAVHELGRHLGEAKVLRKLSLRLASFDFSMERLRLAQNVWEPLISGLNALGQHKRLQSLELSSINMKESWLEHTAHSHEIELSADQPPTLTFLEALVGISSLEELRFISDEIFGGTAQKLADAFRKMEQLKRVDLARNHISPHDMLTMLECLPKHLKIYGVDQQTYCFYN